ncbi:MAG: hypothetical protein E4H20_06695 [Spirochaetales bacterium]|nr:MAG: hypothetical protein E4H20_06695 [Spirochaetales bacterium]
MKHQRKPRRRMPACVLSGALAFLVAISCTQGPSGGLALIDPIFDALVPDAAGQFRRVAGRLVVLPKEKASAAMHAAIDRASPSWVLLSPLLRVEVPGLLASRPDLKIACMGQGSPDTAAGSVYTVRFSDREAADLAGTVLATESMSMEDNGHGILVAGIFSGKDADASARAFSEAFSAAAGGLVPILEVEPSGWSTEAADRLRERDIRLAYVSASTADVKRWTEASFDESVRFIVMAPPMEYPALPRAFGTITWDMGASLLSLIGRIRAEIPGEWPGTWQFVRQE